MPEPYINTLKDIIMNKITFAQLFNWFSCAVIVLLFIVYIAFPDNVTLNTIVYVLIVVEGIVGLLTLKKRQPKLRTADIALNAFWLLLGVVLLLVTYA